MYPLLSHSSPICSTNVIKQDKYMSLPIVSFIIILWLEYMCYLNLCYIQRKPFLEAEIQDLYLSNLRWQKYSVNGMKWLEDEA